MLGRHRHEGAIATLGAHARIDVVREPLQLETVKAGGRRLSQVLLADRLVHSQLGLGHADLLRGVRRLTLLKERLTLLIDDHLRLL